MEQTKTDDATLNRRSAIMDELEPLDRAVRAAELEAQRYRAMLEQRISKMRQSLLFVETAVKERRKPLGTAFVRQGERIEQIIADLNRATDAVKPLKERQAALETEYNLLRAQSIAERSGGDAQEIFRALQAGDRVPLKKAKK